MTSKQNKRADAIFLKNERINSELLVLTYGSMVAQLIRDFEDIDAVNTQLDTMGYNIGVRLIEDFLAKTETTRIHSFKDTAELIAKLGFKIFLNAPVAVNFTEDKNTYLLTLEDNPLAEFADLPPTAQNLWYSNILCGVIRGCLEMVQIKCEVQFIKDVLRGHDSTTIQVTFKEYINEAAPASDD